MIFWTAPPLYYQFGHETLPQQHRQTSGSEVTSIQVVSMPNLRDSRVSRSTGYDPAILTSQLLSSLSIQSGGHAISHSPHRRQNHCNGSCPQIFSRLILYGPWLSSELVPFLQTAHKRQTIDCAGGEAVLESLAREYFYHIKISQTTKLGGGQSSRTSARCHQMTRNTDSRVCLLKPKGTRATVCRVDDQTRRDLAFPACGLSEPSAGRSKTDHGPIPDLALTFAVDSAVLPWRLNFLRTYNMRTKLPFLASLMKMYSIYQDSSTESQLERKFKLPSRSRLCLPLEANAAFQAGPMELGTSQESRGIISNSPGTSRLPLTEVIIFILPPWTIRALR